MTHEYKAIKEITKKQKKKQKTKLLKANILKRNKWINGGKDKLDWLKWLEQEKKKKRMRIQQELSTPGYYFESTICTLRLISYMPLTCIHKPTHIGTEKAYKPVSQAEGNFITTAIHANKTQHAYTRTYV